MRATDGWCTNVCTVEGGGEANHLHFLPGPRAEGTRETRSHIAVKGWKGVGLVS